MNDDTKSLAEQDADAESFEARIQLHERYSTADGDWWSGMFDHVRVAAAAAATEADGQRADVDLLAVHEEQGALLARVGR